MLEEVQDAVEIPLDDGGRNSTMVFGSSDHLANGFVQVVADFLIHPVQ